MAILTVTNGEPTNLAVVKTTPASFDCFTLYEYKVTTNQSDSITITLTGDHFEEVYIDNGVQSSFTDTTVVSFDTNLTIRFLLLNSGSTGVFDTATINITNTTTSTYYENIVTRQNDTANCYSPVSVPTKTSDLLNDGDDGINPFLDGTDVLSYLPLAGGTMSGDIDLAENELQNVGRLDIHRVGADASFLINTWTSDTVYSMNVTGGKALSYDEVSDIWEYNSSEIATQTDIASFSTDADDIIFDSYLTITSANVQAAIQELKDEVDGISGVTVDSVITNGSTNPVENDAIYDALQLKADLASPTFTGTVTLDNGTNGIELSHSGSTNYIDMTGGTLIISSDSQPSGWIFNNSGLLQGSGSSSLDVPTITTLTEAYSAGWQSSLEVPTKGDIYTKIESITGGNVNNTGTPLDNQIAVWTDATTIEGTTGLTYDGSNLLVTGDLGITGTRVTKGWFTDLEVTNTITGDITGDAGTVTSIGNLTGDVTSVNRATTISAGAVDIAMLSASGSPTSSTFLRGDNTWSVPSGSGDVAKVGTPVNNQVGVWTGDGTIEGDVDLTFDGDNLSVGNNVTAGGAVIGSTSNGLRVYGSATGVTNVAYTSFYESNGTTLQGRVGFSSVSNSDLRITNDVAGTYLFLDEAGGVDGLYYYDGTGNRKVWHANNDGAGSGLDADTLDGIDGANFLRSDTTDTAVGPITVTNNLTTNGTLSASDGTAIFNIIPNDGANTITLNSATAGDEVIFQVGGVERLRLTSSGADVTGQFDVTGNMFAPTLEVDGGAGTPLTIKGNGVGTANVAKINFNASDSTNQGQVGFWSAGNSDFHIRNEVSGNEIILEDGGTLTYDNNISITGTGTFTGDVTIPDEVYGGTWNGSLEAPTKNAVYDKIETIASGVNETEGTFTPTIQGATSGNYTFSGSSEFNYTRLGTLVFISLRFLSISGSVPTGTLQVINLPFDCEAGGVYPLAVGSFLNWGTNVDTIYAEVFETGGVTAIRFRQQAAPAQGNGGNISDKDFSSTNITISGCYKTDAA